MSILKRYLDKEGRRNNEKRNQKVIASFEDVPKTWK